MEHSRAQRNRTMLNTRPVTRYASLLAHVALLALVVGYIGLSAFQDANIGLGLGMLTLAAMAAPWSVPIMSPTIGWDSGLFVAVAAGGAMLNLVLHAVALRLWSNRAGRQH